MVPDLRGEARTDLAVAECLRLVWRRQGFVIARHWWPCGALAHRSPSDSSLAESVIVAASDFFRLRVVPRPFPKPRRSPPIPSAGAFLCRRPRSVWMRHPASRSGGFLRRSKEDSHLVNALFSPATTCNWNRVHVPVRDPTENAFKARSSLADNRMPRLPHADGHQEGHHRWAGYEDRHRRLHLRDLPN